MPGRMKRFADLTKPELSHRIVYYNELIYLVIKRKRMYNNLSSLFENYIQLYQRKYESLLQTLIK